MTKILCAALRCTLYTKFLLVCSILIAFASHANAQYNICTDSSRINPYAACTNVYQPVCGCDGKTYRNSCIATNQYGIVSYENSICEAIAVEVKRNPVFEQLEMQILRKDEGDVQLLIFDVYGKLYYSKYYGRLINFIDFVDTRDFPRGVYVIVAYTNRFGTSRKFVKEIR